MKKSERVVFAIAAVVVVLAGIVSMVISLRGRAITDREPFTLEELDQLSARLELMAPSEPIESAQTYSATDSGSDEHAEVPVPTRLERTLSPEELAEKIRWNDDGARRRTKMQIAIFRMIETASWAVGTEATAGHWAFRIGIDHMVLGDWEDARGYLYEALAAPPSHFSRRSICGTLAWLEPDPEKAARLLELACQGKEDVDGGALINAIRLAEATGSDALADHYLNRLRRESPEQVRLLDEIRERDNKKRSGTP